MPSASTLRPVVRRATGTVLAALVLAGLAPVDGIADAARPERQRVVAQRSEARRLDRAPARRLDRAAVRRSDRGTLSDLPPRTRIAYHAETGRVRFLAGSAAAPLASDRVRPSGRRGRQSAREAVASADRFLTGHARLFGAADAARELRPRVSRTRLGRERADASVVRFGQVHGGLPVLGGELNVRLSASGDVLSVSGELLPRVARVRTRPSVAGAAAERAAAAWLARAAVRPVAAVGTSRRGLAIYDARLLGDAASSEAPWSGRPRLVWRVEASVPATSDGPANRRLMLVDAHGGQVVAAIPLHADIVRRVCDSRNRRRADHRCTKPYKRSEGKPPSGIADVDAAYRLMGVVESWYRTRFGRDGIDGRGARMKATVRHCSLGSSCPWNNGQWHWADQQAVFGRGWAQADDIVAHEFTHGVLDHEARLFYHYQSGALNEMFADVFGEAIDLSYASGRDTSFTRWKIGEDTPIGAFRDMRDPLRHGHPDRVRSPRWHSGSSDNGGVHRNSGVGNKAAFLIASGGSFNGQQITGIGVDRMARLFYVAMTEWLTSASDYADLADALNGACDALRGSHGFTDAHCTAVSRTVTATQMDLRALELAPSEAPVCPPARTPKDLFSDDLEDTDSGLWRHARFVGNARGWFYPPNPNNDRRWDATWASSGDMNLYGVDRANRSDTVMRLVEPIVDLPASAFLRFEHGYSFDRGTKRWDGGLVEIRVDGGSWRSVDAHFTHGGYGGRIASGTGNPLRGRRAFTGESHGYGASRIDLSDFAGQTLELRFRLGSDRTGGGYGWYIDDVRVYTCAPA